VFPYGTLALFMSGGSEKAASSNSIPRNVCARCFAGRPLTRGSCSGLEKISLKLLIGLLTLQSTPRQICQESNRQGSSGDEVCRSLGSRGTTTNIATRLCRYERSLSGFVKGSKLRQTPRFALSELSEFVEVRAGCSLNNRRQISWV